MRTLTIQRRKNFAGCLNKMKVYIEDPSAPQITLFGRPCRLLGTLKNGETASFPIDHNAAMLYVVFGKMTATYCSEALPIYPGDQDIYLTGQNEYDPVSGNAFRFDGITLEETLRHRDMTRKKGVKVFITSIVAAVIIGLVIGFLSAGFLTEPCVFSENEVSLTLTNEFSEDLFNEEYYAAFESDDLYVTVDKFSVSDSEFSSPDELIDYLANYDLDNYPIIKDITKENGLLYYEYQTKSGLFTYYIADYVFEENGYFYVLTFQGEKNDFLSRHDEIAVWAASFDIN